MSNKQSYKFDSTEAFIFFIRYVAASAVHQYMKDMATAVVTDEQPIIPILSKNAEIIGNKVFNDIYQSPDIKDLVLKSKS